MKPSRDRLLELDRSIEAAFRSGDEAGLDVLGYGEISTVVALRDGERAWACKRLPPFADASAVARYRAVFGKYLEALDRAGVVPLECSLETVSDTSAYVLQPLLPSNALMPNHLRALDERSAVVLFREVVDKVRCVIDSGNLGIDAQLSNWCLVGGEIRYLDVTTPLLRDSAGREQLDTELFLAALPWALRGAVRAFVLRDILATYYDPRAVVVDILRNLVKERLEHFIAPFVREVERDFDHVITEVEVRRSYASDARLWAALLAVRRLDRAWQHKVRRRPYSFLLPGRIER